MPGIRVVNITEFKAKCLAMIAEVESRNNSIVVTRRGKTVAVVNPPTRPKHKSSRDSWAGRIREVGDLDLASSGYADSWDVVNGRPWPE